MGPKRLANKMFSLQENKDTGSSARNKSSGSDKCRIREQDTGKKECIQNCKCDGSVRVVKEGYP